MGRGTRQGCPASPYLFLSVAQLLANHSKSGNVKGIDLTGRELVITQLADDTTLFLKNESQLSAAIKECSKSSICSIPIKNEVTYLAIIIMKDQQKRTSLNLYPVTQKTQKKLNQWLLRDLSLRGRVLITKAEGVSQLTYASLSLYLNNKLTETDKTLFNFLQKNRTRYVKKSVLMNAYENGGLNFLDFRTLNYTFKTNWLKQVLRNPVSVWSILPLHILSKMGGLNFFLTLIKSLLKCLLSTTRLSCHGP